MLRKGELPDGTETMLFAHYPSKEGEGLCIVNGKEGVNDPTNTEPLYIEGGTATIGGWEEKLDQDWIIHLFLHQDGVKFDYDDEEEIDQDDDPTEGRFKKIASKSVLDSDGFYTDYTWYFDKEEGKHVFVFGDNEIYFPEDGDYDWEVEGDDERAKEEAQEWFDSYDGFEEDDRYDESLKESSDDDLLNTCKEKHQELCDIIEDFLFENDYGKIKEVIKKLYSAVGGRVWFQSMGSHSISFEGDVHGYSLWNSVSMRYIKGDLHRLAEDLTMAFYRTNGGQGYNTYSLMDKIKGTNESLKENLFNELSRDFAEARKNWAKYDPDIDFDSALKIWQEKSPLAEPDTFYSKPLYDPKAWADMVRMFRESEEPLTGEVVSLDNVAVKLAKSGLTAFDIADNLMANYKADKDTALRKAKDAYNYVRELGFFDESLKEAKSKKSKDKHIDPYTMEEVDVYEYKGYEIDDTANGFVLFYCGDDCYFDSLEDAEAFIDSELGESLKESYRLTKDGKQRVSDYISELKAKRKEILDAGKDTADETELPTEQDIVDDLEFIGLDFDDRDGAYYCNGWGVTDNYESDYPLLLKLGRDFEEVNDESLKESSSELPEVGNLKKILDRFNSNGKSAKQGSWSIAKGGYDLDFQVSYKGEPIIDCVDGELHINKKEYEGGSTKEVAKIISSAYKDTSLKEAIDLKNTVNTSAPRFSWRDKYEKFKRDALQYDYCVVKSSNWYDPEGLDVPSNAEIVFAGTKQECFGKLDQIVSEQCKVGHGQPVVEDRGDDYITIYYPSAVAKSTFKIVSSNQINESLKEDYCDMYGCESGFFTRDDLNELMYEINDRCPKGMQATAIYMSNDGRTLEVDMEDDEYGSETVYKKIDMRKIRKPSDLLRYANSIIADFQNTVDKWEVGNEE